MQQVEEVEALGDVKVADENVWQASLKFGQLVVEGARVHRQVDGA
jgi:hypothetical protein